MSNKSEITKSSPAPTPASARFQADVERQFEAQLGRSRVFTDFEARMAQHMFLKVDQALKAAEDRRKGNGKEYSWATIDRGKLAIDTVHRISLGLDALIPNHIWPVTYWNSKKEQYDVDLRIGYVGMDFIARRHAIEPPVDIVYELVYSTDRFTALPRSATREIEAYEFEITSPFNRGDIVGGFGYVIYDDPRKNRLILVTERDFKRSRAASKSNFWTDNPVEMHHKTVMHRVASKIPLDPQKVNASVMEEVLRADEDPVTAAHRHVYTETEASGNQETIDVDVAPAPTEVPDEDVAFDDDGVVAPF